MGKSRGTQTTTSTQTPDGNAQDWMKKVYDAAGAAGTGDPTAQARSFLGGMLPGANLGFSALSGNADATSTLMNPFMSQVIDRMKSNFGDVNAMTSKGIADQATQQHAFGGSRHGVAEGVALAQNGKTAQDSIASTLYGGYNDAMGRAGQLANFGMGAAGALPNLDPTTMRLMALKQGMAGMPFGSTGTVTQPVNRNGAAGALGGALSGGEIGSKFGPWGAGIGAGLGGLLGYFG